MQEQELIRIAENLRYMLYGIGLAGAVVLVLVGVIARYLSKKLDRLEELEYIKFRMDGIESFTRGVVQIDGRLMVIERMLDRRRDDVPVEVERRDTRKNCGDK
jgi:uncharacterized membrane protein